MVQLLEFSVDYAQGFLFGEPRAVRDDAQKPMEALTAQAQVLPLPLRKAEAGQIVDPGARACHRLAL